MLKGNSLEAGTGWMSLDIFPRQEVTEVPIHGEDGREGRVTMQLSSAAHVFDCD